jgi:tRNA G10  N-methylase Trm11
MFPEQVQRYLYSFNYDSHYLDLCRLESRQVFGKEITNKILFSNKRVDASSSAFIRSRLEIQVKAKSFEALKIGIHEAHIQGDGFKAEYLTLEGQQIEKSERNKKLKEVGFCLEGHPNFVAPSITYAICSYQNDWYFGTMVKHNAEWLNHNNKPCSYSNSIGMKVAKTLVNLGSKGIKNLHLLDACCGVGTVLLEACFAGLSIEGCDINPKTIENARKNIAHFHYSSKLYCSDIKDVTGAYDAAIIDLPYNLFSYSNDSVTANIIQSSAKLAPRVIIVSIEDVRSVIKHAGLTILDQCTVEKRGKSKFTRNIWVCERQENK